VMYRAGGRGSCIDNCNLLTISYAYAPVLKVTSRQGRSDK
jgi:hypothetical protein